MTDLQQCPNYENDFMEISTDENGNKIYTFSRASFVKWSWRPDTLQDKYKYTMAFDSSYGFLRIVCDDNNKILAYTHAMPIVPDPFPSQFHFGTWYAFETYNRELIKDFNIKVYNRSNVDDITRLMGGKPKLKTATWEYDSENNSYNLQIGTGIGGMDYWFLVTDKDITSNYGLNQTRTYKFNTVAENPQPSVVGYLDRRLVNAGIKTLKKNDAGIKKLKLISKIKKLFQKERGAQ